MPAVHLEHDDAHPTLGWCALLRTSEAAILGVSLACQAALVGWSIWLATHEPPLAEALPSVLAAHLTTGRAGGITTALSVGFSRPQTIALGSLIEGAVVCLFFPIFSLSFKRLIRLPFLDETLDRVHRSAEAQRGRVLRWGIPGLLAFVWFPFFMTGPVVGSVIGFLLGMRPAMVVAVVLSGTILAIVSWTCALGPVIEWTRRIGEVLPLMVVLILVLFIAGYRLRRIAVAARRRDGQHAEDRDLHT